MDGDGELRRFAPRRFAIRYRRRLALIPGLAQACPKEYFAIGCGTAYHVTKEDPMNDHKPADVSRRSIIRNGIYALTGIAVVSLPGARLAAAETKLAKAAVRYVDAGTEAGKDCDDCIQFIPGKTPAAMGTCKIVEGEINPHGHCIAFTPRK
jgi:hypothetical protein